MTSFHLHCLVPHPQDCPIFYYYGKNLWFWLLHLHRGQCFIFYVPLLWIFSFTLSFSCTVGDHFLLIHEDPKNDWLLVTSLKSRHSGYLPKCCVEVSIFWLWNATVDKPSFCMRFLSHESKCATHSKTVLYNSTGVGVSCSVNGFSYRKSPAEGSTLYCWVASFYNTFGYFAKFLIGRSLLAHGKTTGAVCFCMGDWFPKFWRSAKSGGSGAIILRCFIAVEWCVVNGIRRLNN